MEPSVFTLTSEELNLVINFRIDKLQKENIELKKQLEEQRTLYEVSDSDSDSDREVDP